MCARTKTVSKVVTHLFVLPGTESALRTPPFIILGECSHPAAGAEVTVNGWSPSGLGSFVLAENVEMIF